jgi:hypothetical protein
MKEEMNSERFRYIKRRATKLKKELHIPHHLALDRAAEENGFSNWNHFINDSRHRASLSVRSIARRNRSDKPIPLGTLVRFKPRGSVGMVYKSNGSTVEVYDQWGPFLAAHEEVAICRDQSPASDFRPLRLFLPYGKWTCEDGSQVLFNRDYCPLWKKEKDGTVTAVDPNTWIEHDDRNEEWFYTDGSRPVDNRKTLEACRTVLREWGVEGRRSKLLDLLPAAIQSGNMDLLKGYSHNRTAG